MNMEKAFAMPSKDAKEEDSLAEVPIDKRDIAKEERRSLQNASDFLEQARNYTQELIDARRKPDNEEEVEEIRRGMKLTRNLAEEQMALAATDEDREIFQKSIELIKNNL
ncbi:MAG: hypothetical protein ACD_15C00003G0017 [uncultured bacterium]|nr:MAG: hypothetical protein ACD_15C00003G0017 [uncultured bacterium]